MTDLAASRKASGMGQVISGSIASGALVASGTSTMMGISTGFSLIVAGVALLVFVIVGA